MQNQLDITEASPGALDLSSTEGEYLSLIEAILFTASRDVTIEEIASTLGIPEKDRVKRLLAQLTQLYKSRQAGLIIRETLAGTFVMSPKSELMPRISGFMRDDLLDPSELRTLAIIAFKQPITRTQLRKERSNSSKHVPKLLNLGFITIERSNKGDVFCTTPKFADYFGLSPDASDIKEILGAFVEIQDNDQ